jgi:hypothetical protein
MPVGEDSVTAAGMPNVPRALAMIGRTTPWLAGQSGLAPSYLYDLIAGKAKAPSRLKEDAIARALGLPRYVMINNELTELELRTALSRSALARVSDRIRHPPSSLIGLLDTPLAPVTEEAWLTLDAQLAALGIGRDSTTGSPPRTTDLRSETRGRPGRRPRSDR